MFIFNIQTVRIELMSIIADFLTVFLQISAMTQTTNI